MMLSNKNIDEYYNELFRNNAQFRQFIEANKGKTAEQIALENGINPDFLR